jgi:glycosyltransferase involved in cell wall biosynthesis
VIVIDLSPLAFAPRRGVSRALLHLLTGLDRTRLRNLYLRGYIPRGASKTLGLRPGLPWTMLPTGPANPSPRQWRVALAQAVERDGNAVLLSPWAVFPKTRLPVVAWIHEVPWVGRGALEGKVRTLRHRVALARAVRRAAALVVPAEAVRRDLLEAHPEAQPKVHVVPHGFLPRRVDEVVREVDMPPVFHGFRTLTANVATELPSEAAWYVEPAQTFVPPPTPYVLLLGSGRGAAGPWKKGVDVFLDAFQDARLAGLTPVVVGDPGLVARERPPGLRVYDEPDDVGVAQLVAGARVLVVPSRSEGFGYPVLEGFAAGVPVVASRAGALPEVSGGAARLVPAGDVDALVEAIARLHADEGVRARQIKAGHRRALEFPVEAMAQGWLRVLTKVGGIPWRG